MAFICKYLIPSSVQDLLNKIEAELVNMGWTIHDEYIPFTAGKNPSPALLDTIEGNTSAATARITSITITGGSFAAGTAAGYFGIDTLVGKFVSETVKNNTHPLNPAATTNGTYGVVYKSNGELGDRIYEYVRFSFTTSTTQLDIAAYAYWSNTGRWYACIAGTNGFLTYGVDYKFVLAGTKNLVICHRIGYSDNDFLFGHIPKRFYANPLATITAGPTGTGIGVVLPLSNTTKFIENKTYWIMGSLGEGRDRIKVTSVNPGVSITGDGLTIPFAAGAMIGASPSMFILNQTGTDYIYSTSCKSVGAGVGTGEYIPIAPFIAAIYLNPDASLGYEGAPLSTTGLYVLQPILFSANPSNDYPVGYCDEYLFYPPILSVDSIYGITGDGLPLSTGTVTNASFNTLECLGKGWGINAYANKAVILVSGVGSGYTRRIISNTADTLTVGENWDTIPTGLTIFYIVDEAYRVAGTHASYLAYREYI
jgi:hypothetical protein